MNVVGNRKGITLVSILIIGVVMTIVGNAARQLVESLGKNYAALQVKGDLAELRQSLLTRMSCSRTLEGVDRAIECTADHYIPLKDRNGNALTEELITSGSFKGAGRIGKYLLRTSCSAQGQTLKVEIAQERSLASVSSDPLTRQLQSFGEMPPLIRAFGCPGSDGNPAIKYHNLELDIAEYSVGSTGEPSLLGPHVSLGTQTIELKVAGPLIITGNVNVNPWSGMTALFYVGVFIDNVQTGMNRTMVNGCDAIGNNIPLIFKSGELSPGIHTVEYKLLEFTSWRGVVFDAINKAAVMGYCEGSIGSNPPANRAARFTVSAVTQAPNEILTGY